MDKKDDSRWVRIAQKDDVRWARMDEELKIGDNG